MAAESVDADRPIRPLVYDIPAHGHVGDEENAEDDSKEALSRQEVVPDEVVQMLLPHEVIQKSHKQTKTKSKHGQSDNIPDMSGLIARREAASLPIRRDSKGNTLPHVSHYTAVFNHRDIGGYKTASGKRVKYGQLFRSGTLDYATMSDKMHLWKMMKTVVDFRGDVERTQAIQTPPPGLVPTPGARTEADLHLGLPQQTVSAPALRVDEAEEAIVGPSSPSVPARSNSHSHINSVSNNTNADSETKLTIEDGTESADIPVITDIPVNAAEHANNGGHAGHGPSQSPHMSKSSASAPPAGIADATPFRVTLQAEAVADDIHDDVHTTTDQTDQQQRDRMSLPLHSDGSQPDETDREPFTRVEEEVVVSDEMKEKLRHTKHFVDNDWDSYESLSAAVCTVIGGKQLKKARKHELQKQLQAVHKRKESQNPDSARIVCVMPVADRPVMARIVLGHAGIRRMGKYVWTLATTWSKDEARRVMIPVVGNMGLGKFYGEILNHAQEDIRTALEVLTEPTNHPATYHCTHGKDRTGLITALLLHALGVSREDIVYDYSRSGALLPDSLKNTMPDQFSAEWRESPPHAIEKAFDILIETYGSVDKYLDCLGFTEPRREQFRQVMLE